MGNWISSGKSRERKAPTGGPLGLGCGAHMTDIPRQPEIPQAHLLHMLEQLAGIICSGSHRCLPQKTLQASLQRLHCEKKIRVRAQRVQSFTAWVPGFPQIWSPPFSFDAASLSHRFTHYVCSPVLYSFFEWGRRGGTPWFTDKQPEQDR